MYYVSAQGVDERMRNIHIIIIIRLYSRLEMFVIDM